MSQFFGAGNEKGMKQSLLFKFILAFIGIGIYMFIMGFAGIPSTICAVLSSALREIGDVKPPLVISACATFLNTFLDWVFIYGKFGLPAMEVRGAAIATFIAMSIQMLAFIIYIDKPFKYNFIIHFQNPLNHFLNHHHLKNLMNNDNIF